MKECEMPLEEFDSICEKNAKIIVSQDKGARSPKHIANNKSKNSVTHYRIDGVVITQGKRCDFLLMNEDKKVAYLIELKGSDLCHASEQLEATASVLVPQLANYKLQYRIVYKTSRTHQIESSKFKRYKNQWGTALKQKSIQLEEDI